MTAHAKRPRHIPHSEPWNALIDNDPPQRPVPRSAESRMASAIEHLRNAEKLLCRVRRNGKRITLMHVQWAIRELTI